MSDPVIDVVAAPPPVPNASQRNWLRELGVERLWLSAPPASSREAAASQGQAEAAARAADVSAARAAAGIAAATTPVAAAVTSPGQTPSAPMPSAARPEPVQRVATPARPPAPRSPASREAAEPAPVQVVTAEALALLDFDALQAQVTDCKACGLCTGRHHAVVGMGARPARWMVVGEAPGEQEDRQGLPFVGRSGQLLDAMLEAVGMSRERDVYIANVIKCRPPGNRNPKPEEIAACSPYLMRQIELLQPECLLVLGRFAAQTLLNTDASIANLRGRVHHVEVAGRSIPLVVSYHPAYLLRSPTEKARAWQDLQRARALA